MKELEQDIVNWNEETFPNANHLAFVNKLAEELEEAKDALGDLQIMNTREEIADVCIVAISMYRRLYNTSLEQAIRDKFEVVKQRSWGKEDANGNREKV